jgi:hypothetical protein
VSEMKPLGLDRGHTGQYSRPRRWRRDAGADAASPLLALGPEKGVQDRGASVSEMKPLGRGRGHTGQYSRPRRWRRDAGADVASPLLALGSEKALGKM